MGGANRFCTKEGPNHMLLRRIQKTERSEYTLIAVSVRDAYQIQYYLDFVIIGINLDLVSTSLAPML